MRNFLIRILKPNVLIFAVTALIMPFRAGAQDTSITLPDKKLSPAEVFDIVHAQTKYKVTANMSRLNDAVSVRVSKSPVAVSAVLNKLLEGSGFTYAIDGDFIVVYSAPGGNAEEGSVVAVITARTIAGSVRDGSEDTPLENVLVEILNLPGAKTVTNAIGRFGMDNIPSGSHIVKLSSADGENIRYREITVPASGDADFSFVMNKELLAPAESNHEESVPESSVKKTTAYYIPKTTDHTVHALTQQPKSDMFFVSGSQVAGKQYLPKAAIKTNLLIWGTTTPNVAVEFGLARKWTLDLSAAYNPFQLQKGGVNHITVVSPEVRYWFCQRFEKHFIGLHGLAGTFNLGEVTFLTRTFETHRYDGWGVGAGLSYGYHLPIAKRWAMEFTVGAGYVYLEYDKYRCYECDEYLGNRGKHYFGPTKAGISLIYMIK